MNKPQSYQIYKGTFKDYSSPIANLRSINLIWQVKNLGKVLLNFLILKRTPIQIQNIQSSSKDLNLYKLERQVKTQLPKVQYHNDPIQLPINQTKYFQKLSQITNGIVLKQVQEPIECIVKPKAQTYIVYDVLSETVLEGQSADQKMEMASLTKMMTFLIVCKLLQCYQIDPTKLSVQVSKQAQSIGGTSAYLKYQDRITIYDLLFGMMLPSGNDAAMVLSEAMGIMMYGHPKYPLSYLLENGCINIENITQRPEFLFVRPEYLFILEMNQVAKSLGLKNTHFTSTHGLCDISNYSTAFDLAKLCYECQQIPIFNQVVKTQTYVTRGLESDQSYIWRNTNKLLGKGFNGVKTGFTEGAGPCLCASYQRTDCLEIPLVSLIIVLMNSETGDQRWLDCKILVEKYEKVYRQQDQKRGKKF